MEFQDVTDDLITLCRTVLGTALTGIYLHGSMAMGCFHAGQSDLGSSGRHRDFPL